MTIVSLIMFCLLRSICIVLLDRAQSNQVGNGTSIWQDELIFSLANTQGLWFQGSMDHMDMDYVEALDFAIWSMVPWWSSSTWPLGYAKVVLYPLSYLFYVLMHYLGHWERRCRVRVGALPACPRDLAALVLSFYRWLHSHWPCLDPKCKTLWHHCWGLLPYLWSIYQLVEVLDHF